MQSTFEKEIKIRPVRNEVKLNNKDFILLFVIFINPIICVFWVKSICNRKIKQVLFSQNYRRQEMYHNL